jgi:hypothetical protein
VVFTPTGYHSKTDTLTVTYDNGVATGQTQTAALSGVGINAACTGSETTYHDHGSGTGVDPYILCIPAQLLHWMANYTTDLDKSFQLGEDIDMTGYDQTNGIHPIGDAATAQGYSGTFDGNDFSISNLSYTNATNNSIGLFSDLSGSATIQNLSLLNVYFLQVGNGWDAGAVFGDSEAGSTVTISKVTVSGTIASNTQSAGVGGIGGWLGGTVSISKSSSSVVAANTASVASPSTSTGGIIGACQGTCSITNSYATGAISGLSGTGGLAGGMVTGSTSLTITTSYATGAISGGTDGVSGGLVGYGHFGTVNITNSFAVGAVVCNSTYGTSTTGKCGRLIGDYANLLNITTSYYYSGAALSNDGAAGLSNFAGMTAEAALSWFYDPANAPLSAWDFTTIWSSNLSSSGYPTLR